MEAADFFAGSPEALAIHREVESAIERLGEATTRATKSQVGFYRTRPFAATWRPDQYLAGKHAPLVLSIYLDRRDNSPRWKEVVQPAKGRFTHHLELYSSKDVDEFVRCFLEEAWEAAGQRRRST